MGCLLATRGLGAGRKSLVASGGMGAGVVAVSPQQYGSPRLAAPISSGVNMGATSVSRTDVLSKVASGLAVGEAKTSTVLVPSPIGASTEAGMVRLIQ